MISIRHILIGPIVALWIVGCNSKNSSELTRSLDELSEVDPVNAIYTIEGSDIQLRDGHFEMPAAPGSAAKITVEMFDTPAYGNLNGDGDIDAAVILVYQSGGSGTFYYLGAALNKAGNYRGTNALFLGDRIIPQAVTIENRTIVVDFADRAPSEPMAAAPTVDATKYAYIDGDSLEAVPEGSQESGWVTFGHEVRSFLPCNGNAEHWLLGSSPAISDLEKTYRTTMENALPYTPLFMVLTGSFMEPPSDGFGTDYEGAFFATGLIDADATGHCRKEFIAVESPAPGTVIESPLSIRGRARGTWFFEGDFPIILEDKNGDVVANGFMVAQGEWMTKEFVPFIGTLSFTRLTQGGRGSLVFKKDNPSDRQELDDEMSIPVFFQE
jgi:hypothetical protein